VNSEIRRVVLTVLNSFLRQTCLVSSNVTSALAYVSLTQCAINKSKFTYFLPYLLTYLGLLLTSLVGLWAEYWV